MSNWKRWEKERVEVDSEWFSRMGAAKYVGVSISTFGKYVARKHLIGYKLPPGRLWKFRKADLDNFIAENSG